MKKLTILFVLLLTTSAFASINYKEEAKKLGVPESQLKCYIKYHKDFSKELSPEEDDKNLFDLILGLSSSLSRDGEAINSMINITLKIGTLSDLQRKRLQDCLV